MPIRYVMNRAKRFFIYRVLHVDDTPHRIALGVAIGIFIAWTPTIGFQMILTVALAMLLRANKLVGLPFVWFSNPLTIFPIYGPNFLVGSWLFGWKYSWDEFERAFARASHFQGHIIPRIQAWWQATWPIFLPLWLGSLMVGLVLGFLTYFAVLYAVVTYRQRWHIRHPSPAMPEHQLPKR
ncbi:MAG: DUF2062 domain-containing protein [Planctomycetota bacterium]|nr:DUF2062 domain-containing protein [Planctomycetota bacterium]